MSITRPHMTISHRHTKRSHLQTSGVVRGVAGGSSSSLRITRGRCVSMHAPDHDNAPMRMHSQPRRPSSPRTMHPFGYTSSGCMSSGCSPWCLDAREPELGPAPPRARGAPPRARGTQHSTRGSRGPRHTSKALLRGIEKQRACGVTERLQEARGLVSL